MNQIEPFLMASCQSGICSTECGAALFLQFLHSILFYGVRNRTEHSQGLEVCYKQILNHV